MNSHHASIIAQYFAEAISSAVDGDRDYLITIAVSGDSSKWVQVSWGMINAAYPFTEAPDETLERLAMIPPAETTVCEWKAGEWVTFEHSATDVPALSRFVCEYLWRVLSASAVDALVRVAD